MAEIDLIFEANLKTIEKILRGVEHEYTSALRKRIEERFAEPKGKPVDSLPFRQPKPPSPDNESPLETAARQATDVALRELLKKNQKI